MGEMKARNFVSRPHKIVFFGGCGFCRLSLHTELVLYLIRGTRPFPPRQHHFRPYQTSTMPRSGQRTFFQESPAQRDAMTHARQQAEGSSTPQRTYDTTGGELPSRLDPTHYPSLQHHH